GPVLRVGGAVVPGEALLPEGGHGGRLGRILPGAADPNLLGDPATDGEGALEAPATDLVARTPGEVLGAPLTMPDGSNHGIPNATLPKLGLTGPELVGASAALLGLQ
ncbi:hypothetical protein ACWERJ_34035, partial [Streptomyces sp. NPDC004050]